MSEVTRAQRRPRTGNRAANSEEGSNGCIRIECGVPLPTAAGRQGIYPFGKMKLGESFAIPDGKLASVRAAAFGYAVRHGNIMKFAVRRHNGGYRCWRIE